MKERKTSFSKLLKRALIVALCLVMALGTTVTIMAASFNGDLDGDGKVTAYDAQMLAEYEAGDRDLDPATVIGLTVRGILDRVLGKIVDEPVDDPAVENDAVVKTVEVKAEEGIVTEELTFTEENVTVTIPVGVKVTGAELVVTVSKMDASEGGLTAGEGEELLPLDIHVEGVAEDNTTAIIIGVAGVLEAGMNLGNVTVYHVEDGEPVAMTQVMDVAELTAHNSFYYDPATGDITVAMATFSEVTTISETAKAWNGGFDYSWYDAKADELYIANADQLAAFGAIVGGMKKVTGINEDRTYTYSDEVIQDSFSGKTVKLIADINLGDNVDPTIDYSEDMRVFYPIGYWNDEGTYEKSGKAISSGFYNFCGTFDGQGHTISNLYHQTWEMKGDNNYYDAALQYYRDGMGLFGKVYGGTVKNLTVDNFSSDGEYTTTGTIAAYAEGATFENIAITNCNPRVYNIGNGGIVGCVGWYAKDAGLKTTFKNITVDNSNKISALWGSWDVACGGIVGQYYPTSGQSSANYPANGGVYFENCHVAAQIDVYNDVCANYQYYAYRYAGILIGSVRENETVNGYSYPKMDGITASGCTVHFGDWNDYYYCELVANSLASYTHDHQMSRLTQVASVDAENMQIVTLKGETQAIPSEGRVNYVVVKEKNANDMWIHGDGHAFADCYHFVNGEQHFHDKADADNPEIYEMVDGVQTLKEDKQLVYREFNNLVTGYGWGVTSKGVDDLEGVTILERTVADSVEKFEAAANAQSITVQNGIAVKLGDLFTALENPKVAILQQNVLVSITDLTENDGVNTTVTVNKKGFENWQDYELTVHGAGLVEITVQDYYFCTPASIKLNVGAHIHCECGALTTLDPDATCSECGKSAKIWEPTAAMPADDATGHYYLTGNVEKDNVPSYTGKIAICLNGCNVTTGGYRFLQAASGSVVSISDCQAQVVNGAYTAGKISGSENAAIRIFEGATFKLYDGHITGNKNTTNAGSGVVYLNAGTEATGRAYFYMYGGKISGNELNMRGAVFTAIPGEGQIPGEIHILGGEITENIGHAMKGSAPFTPSNGVAGGAGIYSFGPVYVGGDAYISGNICDLETSYFNADIVLRTVTENALYGGKLIVEEALTDNAEVNYGTYYKDNSDDLQAIIADDSLLIDGDDIDGVYYEGNVIYYENGRYYTQHIHCLCGNDTVIDGEVCSSCGSDAVEWTGTNAMPTSDATGYYYLQQDVTRIADINYYQDGLHICLNHHTVNLSDHKINIGTTEHTKVSVTISDCMAVTAYNDMYSAGQITGYNTKNVVIKILSNATLKLYDGMITGNTTDTNLVWLQASTDAANMSRFYMYGGEISGNTVARGAVFTEVPGTNEAKDNIYAGEIYILGGAITENNGTETNSGAGGGAGVYAFGSVYVGGDAKIIGNTEATTLKNADMMLRNDRSYQGKLIISAEKPLQAGAQISCDTEDADDKANLSITGTPSAWDAGWILYNGDYVHYENGVFFQGHTHCLCGATVSGSEACPECGYAPVDWTAWTKTDSLPGTTGNYYLVSDVTVTYAADATQATVISMDNNVAIDLCGHNILNENGDRLFYLNTNATLSITDCQDEAGMISGFGKGNNSECAITLCAGSELNLYNGKIANNTGGDDGVIYVQASTTFNMYGGEISNNVSEARGAICAYDISGKHDTAPVVRILGGKITGNSSTTNNTNYSGGGIYSFGHVYVGGDAYIAGNSAATDNNPDIYLRGGGYCGKMFLDSDYPLTADAKIDYSVSTHPDEFDPNFICFSSEAYEIPEGVLTCNGQAIVDEIPVDSGEGEAEQQPA